MAEFVSVLLFLALCSSAVFAFGPVVRGDRHTRARRFGLLGPSETSEARSSFAELIDKAPNTWDFGEIEVASSVVTSRIELVAQSRAFPRQALIQQIDAQTRTTRSYLRIDSRLWADVWLGANRATAPPGDHELVELHLVAGEFPAAPPDEPSGNDEPLHLVAMVARSNPAPLLKPLRHLHICSWLPLLSQTGAWLTPAGIVAPISNHDLRELDSLVAQLESALNAPNHDSPASGLARSARAARWLDVPLAAGRAGFATDDPWLRMLDGLASGGRLPVDELVELMKSSGASLAERAWVFYSLLNFVRSRSAAAPHEDLQRPPANYTAPCWALAWLLHSKTGGTRWRRRSTLAHFARGLDARVGRLLVPERSAMDRTFRNLLEDLDPAHGRPDRSRGAVSLHTPGAGGALSLSTRPRDDSPDA